MTKTPSRHLLLRVLERPELARSIEALAPAHFAKLVRHVGLEDAGELLALATREQVELLLDDELWKSARPGQDETFDAERFALWLEVLLEGGDAHAARRLSELSEELLLLGFSRCLLVLDLDALGAELSTADDPSENDAIEKALDGCLYQEFDEYRAIARRHAGWDAVVGALVALDREHHALLARLLERLAAASSEYIDDNGGLYEVLTSEEMLENDAAAEREDRRAAAGFVAPSSARAFLALAERESVEAIAMSSARDPITKAYFRELDRTATNRAARSGSKLEGNLDGELAALLCEAGVLDDAGPARLGAGKGDPLFTRALVQLKSDDPTLYAARMEELAFLANVLVTGSADAHRPLRAIERAIHVCQLGLEHLTTRDASVERAVEAVRANGADKLFRLGWRVARTQPS